MKYIFQLRPMLLILLLTGSITLGAQEKTPPARVTSLSGRASFTLPAKRTDGGSSRSVQKIELYSRIPKGAIVTVRAGSRVEMVFTDGKRYQLTGRAKARINLAGPTILSGNIRELDVLPTNPAGIKGMGESTSAAVRLRSGAIGGLYPNRDTNALPDETVLSFTPVDNVPTYHISIEDKSAKVIFSTDTVERQISVPHGILRPGSHYAWRVTGITNNGTELSGQADFRTFPLPRSDAKRLSDPRKH